MKQAKTTKDKTVDSTKDPLILRGFEAVEILIFQQREALFLSLSCRTFLWCILKIRKQMTAREYLTKGNIM